MTTNSKDRFLTIRTMNAQEVSIAADWAGAEGWNPGLHDKEIFYATDPGGFFLGLAGGEPVATISLISYGSTFAFIGFYIVKPAYRGQGYGMQIWRHAIAAAGGRNIGLDGVVAQQENYKKSGFRLAYRTARYELSPVGSKACPTHATTNNIISLFELPFEEVVNYDDRFFPESRPVFLRHWISQPGHLALAVVEGSRLAGYGVIRPCLKGYRIGPLFADSRAIAEDLFCSLTRDTEGEPVFLDVPEVNSQAEGMALEKGMKKVFETARMYTGKEPQIALERLFGITTLELG